MKHQKTNILTSILDELANVGFLSCKDEKLQLLGFIKEMLSDYKMPTKPRKADLTMQSLQKLAKVNSSDINKQLLGLAKLSEKALSEL